MRAAVAQSYVPELDGLRAIAILAVMIFHAAPSFLPGGFLGVEVFFVLSGFLITSLLVTEYDSLGRIDFRNFYLRRGLRLFPGLIVMVGLVCLAGSFLLKPESGERLVHDGILVFSYTYNWLRAFEIRTDGYLSHSWSLAIEEQFYFLWPPLLAFGLMKCKTRESLAKTVFTFALLAMIWRSIQLGQDVGLNRIYNGLDTRCDGILCGCAAAIALSIQPLRERVGSRIGSIPATMALVIFAGLILSVSVFDLAAYTWSLPLTTGVTALLLAHSTLGEESWLRRLLAAPPLVWVGQRSYGLYLWHYPILRIGRDCGLNPSLTIGVAVVLTLLMAELSYRLIERPLLSQYKHCLRPRKTCPEIVKAPAL